MGDVIGTLIMMWIGYVLYKSGKHTGSQQGFFVGRMRGRKY
jgi:hypothetical protein